MLQSPAERKYRYMRLSIGQTEPTTLLRVQRALDCGSIQGPYARKNRKDVWQWGATGRTAHIALNQLWPYLSQPKRDQAQRVKEAEQLGLYKDRLTCKRGHDFTGDNVYVDAYGYRSCKECKKMGKRER